MYFSKPQRPPKAVIFDIGRVIVRLVPERALDAISKKTARGRSGRQLWKTVQMDSRWHDWQEGRMSPREWHEHLSRQLGVSVGFEEFCAAWNRTLHPKTILPDSLFANLATRCKLAVLSNTDPLHSAALKSAFTFLRHFPDRIYSWRVGASKPSAAIYQAALERLGVPAAEALYIDDVDEYAQAARAIGLDAIVFASPSQLLKELAIRGLPANAAASGKHRRAARSSS